MSDLFSQTPETNPNADIDTLLAAGWTPVPTRSGQPGQWWTNGKETCSTETALRRVKAGAKP